MALAPRLRDAIAGLLFTAVPAFADAPLMHVMFQDHAVLQRDRPITIWGDTAPGMGVTVTLASASAQGVADGSGHWSVTLPAMQAGGPYTLEAKTDSGVSETAGDILVGDVWLCAGQSNMVLTARAAGGFFLEQRTATDSQMRMMTIADTASLTPLSTFATPVKWEVESPDTIANFSASCYFYARELKKTVNVPMGMVVAAWGGSLVQDWMSDDAVRKTHLFDRDLAIKAQYAASPQAGYAAWGEMWQDWWRKHAPKAGELWSPSYDDSGWPVVPDLSPWGNWKGTDVADFLGDMWYRTTVTLTAAQAAQAAKLSLGRANEEDIAWVNGKAIGAVETGPALHDVPAGTLHEGVNTIALNLFCSWRNCGLTATPDKRLLQFADGTSVTIANPWRYQPVPESVTMAPREPWGELGGISMAYNGLIAPIGPYGFRGAVWYQGESNIYWTKDYETLLTAMMADWRKTYGADLPFLVVQIPNYATIPTHPMASGWAEVREAQRLAVSQDPHAGLAVTVDIGDALNLHPPKKQELGRRLSIAARHVIYGENIAPSGPEPAGAFAQGGHVVVPFKGVTGKLVSYSGDPNAFELCGTTQASCRYVDATIRGNSVVLAGDAAKATRVRFCWGDSPVCTLYDTSGLPAGPFEVPIRSAPKH
jgi:sialate O-acetylesterase